MKNMSFLPQWLRVFFGLATLNMICFMVAWSMGKTGMGSIWSVTSFGAAAIKWSLVLYYQNQSPKASL
ncbi:hypothetical protein SAMN05444359_114127 [Neolewinella agarilytica]|uniref:Uncharacterized protein n=1 Tax=Neolewinella agarilytica TaxID=478744 RepID=A0A1H9IBH4_9BACT|nr:hypothetical protein SAMN05444359_114127 [Neolewinella agarilytica]